MANCSLTTLSTAAKCFDCLSQTEKLLLRTWFLAQAVKGLGGADLTNINTQRSTVACFTCEPDFRIGSMLVAIDQRTALNAGASVNLSISQLRAAIKCGVCGEQKTNRAAYMYLKCQLNAFLGTGAN